MKNIDERWGDFTFEEPQEARFLALPNSVMEHICRYLDKTSDKYVACFIHRQWTTAAQNVLWERPRFELPVNFRVFLKNIQENKKTALLVRDVYLAFLDHEETLFEPIVKSTAKRHDPEGNVLSNSNFMVRVAKTCEKLNTLSVYGWNLETALMDGLASTAQDLTSLHIIGAKPKHQLAFNNLLSRLTRLRLDGVFNLNDRWASSLVNKAINLTELQLSLKDISLDVLKTVCTPGKLALTCLIFTDAENMSDHYVNNVLHAFPLLTRFCLEGSIRVTALSILHGLRSCPKLNSIEIRAHQDSLGYELQGESLAHFNSCVYDPLSANPCRLLVENLNLDSSQLISLSPYLSLIQTLGFKNCPQLTTAAIEQCLSSNRFVRTFQSISCANIGSDLLKAFSTMVGVSKSLYRVHLESSGSVDPKDIFQLCCSSTDHNLRQIRLVDYESIQQSAIGNYNESLPNQRHCHNLPIITLNRVSIDAIAHTTDPELCPVPDDRLVNGSALVRLADHFKMDLDDLLDLLDSFDEEHEMAMKSASRQKNISFDPSANFASGNKPASRVFALKAQSSNMRPATPALWSQDLEHNDTVENYEESGSDGTTSNGNGEETDDSRDDSRDVTEEDEEEYDTSSHLTFIDTNKSVPNPAVLNTNTGSEITSALGGWGVSAVDQWDAYPKPHNPMATRTPSPPQERKSRTHAWTGFTADNYTDQWQQNSLAFNNTKASTKRTAKHYRNSPVVAESDGWGSTDKYVPWQNVNEQGFVTEVIEEQKKTNYWNGEEYINPGSASNTANDYDNDTTVVASSGNKTPGSPPMLFSDLANNLSTSSNSRSLNNDHRNRSQSISRPRSGSLVSSDGSVSWNDVPVESAIKVSSNKPKSKFSVDKKQKIANTGRSRWANEEDWNALKQSNSDVTLPSSAPTLNKGSWQSNFSPEVIADKTAKNEWSSISANASPRDTKFSRPSRKGRDSVPPANMSNNWAELINSPPFSAASTSPNQNVKPQSAVLVDTDNFSEISSNSKGDVWESISTLDISPTRPPTASQVLIPQEAPSSKRVSVEVINWDMDSSEELPKENTPKENMIDSFRFVEEVAGTITEAEKKSKEQQQSNDNLVDFEALIPTFSYPQPIIPVSIASKLSPDNIPELENLPIDITPVTNESNMAESSFNNTNHSDAIAPDSPKQDNLDTSIRPEKKIKLYKKRIPVAGVLVPFSVQEDENIEEAVTKFCMEHSIMDQVESITTYMQESKIKQQTDDILAPPGKKMKKKPRFP